MPKNKKVGSALGVERISVSLPRGLARQLDSLVASKGFLNRSQAVAAIISNSVLETTRTSKEAVMAGSITLFYNQTRNGLLAELAKLRRRHIDEVIGSLQVQLEGNHMMEVMIVQGPAATLERITDAFVACKGVKAGKLSLTSATIPPIHPLAK